MLKWNLCFCSFSQLPSSQAWAKSQAFNLMQMDKTRFSWGAYWNWELGELFFQSPLLAACATSLVTANLVLLVLLCLPCTGRFFWRGNPLNLGETPWIWGKHPGFRVGPQSKGVLGVLRGFGGILEGFLERFWEIWEGWMEQVCVRFGFLRFGCTRTLPVTVVKVLLLLLTWAGQSTLRPDLF